MKRLAAGLAAIALAGSANAALIEVDFSGSFNDNSYRAITESGSLVYDTAAPEITAGSDTFRLVSASLTYQSNPTPQSSAPAQTYTPAFDSGTSIAYIYKTGTYLENLDFSIDNFYVIHIDTLHTFADHALPSSYTIASATVGIPMVRDMTPTVTYHVLDTTPPIPTPTPEPTTWALMLAGFGLTGTALRRRRAGLPQGFSVAA